MTPGGDRCPSCGRVLGDVIRTTYSGRAVIVTYEVEDEETGERVEREHRCGD